MKQYGSRLELISVRDLSKENAIKTLRALRGRKVKTDNYTLDDHLFDKVYEMVGGRLAFLTKVAKSRDMIEKCKEISEMEKTWFLVCISFSLHPRPFLLSRIIHIDFVGLE